MPRWQLLDLLPLLVEDSSSMSARVIHAASSRAV